MSSSPTICFTIKTGKMGEIFDLLSFSPNPDGIPFKKGDRCVGVLGRGLGTIKDVLYHYDIYGNKGKFIGYYVEYDNGFFHTCDVYSIGHLNDKEDGKEI